VPAEEPGAVPVTQPAAEPPMPTSPDQAAVHAAWPPRPMRLLRRKSDGVLLIARGEHGQPVHKGDILYEIRGRPLTPAEEEALIRSLAAGEVIRPCPPSA